MAPARAPPRSSSGASKPSLMCRGGGPSPPPPPTNPRSRSSPHLHPRDGCRLGLFPLSNVHPPPAPAAASFRPPPPRRRPAVRSWPARSRRRPLRGRRRSRPGLPLVPPPRSAPGLPRPAGRRSAADGVPVLAIRSRTTPRRPPPEPVLTPKAPMPYSKAYDIDIRAPDIERLASERLMPCPRGPGPQTPVMRTSAVSKGLESTQPLLR